MILRFPRTGYHRPLSTLTDHELYLYALRGPDEAREVEQARERRRTIKAEAEARLCAMKGDRSGIVVLFRRSWPRDGSPA